ncbi:MAG TPA: thioredoxin family protein [Desulfobacterales bacterium]|nr:thioredoxin family protein [Desulfobacterales bacterium]
MAEIDDAPLQRQIKIGRATIGLVGLDVALNRLMQENLNRETAIDELFKAVAARNYIPAGMADKYRQALAQEYDRLKAGLRENDDQKTLTIRILGSGCVSCNNLQKLIIEIMARLRVAADIFQVHDLDEIGRYGVMQTPALIINGRLKSAGRLPSSSQIEEWLRQEMDK